MQPAIKKHKLLGVMGLCLSGCLILGAQSASAEERVTVTDPGLKSYVIVDEISIPESLTGKPGNPEVGKKLFVHRKKGNCLTCHTAPIPEEEFHGKVAPGLEGVADRMSEGEIRLRVVNPKIANPDTPMMAFYKTSGLTQVKKGFVEKPMLNEEEIEDVVAYLMTLKESN